jgi:hypothetical protein
MEGFMARHGDTEFAKSKADELRALRKKLGRSLELLLHLPLETDARGESTNKVTAALIGNTTWAEAAGRLCLDTSGGGHALVSDVDLLNTPKKALTLMAWAYVASGGPAGYRIIASRHISGTGGEHYSIGARAPGAKPYAWITTPNGACGVSDERMLLDRWTHIAVTYDGRKVRLYVDGALVRSGDQSGSIPDDSSPLVIGGNINHGKTGELLRGCVRDVRLYDKALSRDDIVQIVELGR